MVVFGRSARRDYIVAKYVEHRFARRSTPEPQRLWMAICNRDLLSVLEAFANGQDFGQLLLGPEGQVRTPPRTTYPPTLTYSPVPGTSYYSLLPTSDICWSPTHQRGRWGTAQAQSHGPELEFWLWPLLAVRSTAGHFSEFFLTCQTGL